MLVEIKERKTTYSNSKLLISWHIVCCTESHSLINIISLVQTLCSNNEGSMKIEEQQEGKCLRIGLVLLKILLVLFISSFSLPKLPLYPVQTPTPPNTHRLTQIRLMDEEIEANCCVHSEDDIIWPMCWSCLPKSWDPPFSPSPLCLPLIFQPCYASLSLWI